MSATVTHNPINDLTFDWLTILQNKAAGVASYDRYIKDAEAEKATECVKMLKRCETTTFGRLSRSASTCLATSRPRPNDRRAPQEAITR